MNGLTDYHAHFVYGVDDGAQTREEMYAMLDAAGQQTVCGTCLLPPTARRAWNASHRKSTTGIWLWPAHTAHKKATT